MPRQAKRPCREPRCVALVEGGGYCDQHKRVHKHQLDGSRGSAASRGYGRAWREASAAFLRAHPLCQCDECQEGKLRATPSEVTDHRVPHRGDERLFWDVSNWQAMSKRCHDRKTAREDGGWGNRVRRS